ncbi:MAG: hypothetical protein KIT80_20975 [Chitinophagaceae bacterium]|nr:hypothetical protein [Chitinophagaceae bacterium]MCW5929407.1 hypothetical protein [Chitinophagaceae bacterium]
MRKKLIIFFAVAIFCAGFAWYRFNKPRESAAAQPADITIHAQRLYEMYTSNETDADKRYLNKIIEVNGVIEEVETYNNDIIITLGLQASGGISCRLFPGEKPDEKLMTKGREVTLKGKCTGFNIDVNLTDCVIVQ